MNSSAPIDPPVPSIAAAPVELATGPAVLAVAPAPPAASHWRADLARIAAVCGVLAALIGFGYVMQGPVKRMGPAERCWENREIDGKLYRYNPCTGQFKLLGDVIPGAVIPGAE